MHSRAHLYKICLFAGSAMCVYASSEWHLIEKRCRVDSGGMFEIRPVIRERESERHRDRDSGTCQLFGCNFVLIATTLHAERRQSSPNNGTLFLDKYLIRFPACHVPRAAPRGASNACALIEYNALCQRPTPGPDSADSVMADRRMHPRV